MPGYRRYYLDTLLEVARRENDASAILRLAQALLLDSRDLEYYDLIKATLPSQAWPEKFESLIAGLKATSRA